MSRDMVGDPPQERQKRGDHQESNQRIGQIDTTHCGHEAPDRRREVTEDARMGVQEIADDGSQNNRRKRSKCV